MKHLYRCRVCKSELWLEENAAVHCGQPANRVFTFSDYSYSSDKYRTTYAPLSILRGDTIKSLNSRYKSGAKTSHKQLAYGQHLSCSGDRYGMFYALALFRDAALAFFCSGDRPSITKLLGYTEFYASGLEGLDNLGYKIVPILTQGDATAESSRQFAVLNAAYEKEAVAWSKVEGSFVNRAALLEGELAAHKRGVRPLDREQAETFDRRRTYLENKVETHRDKSAAAKDKNNKAKLALMKFYWQAVKNQNAFARELEVVPFHSPFVWSNVEDLTWRGGNQLYSDASEPNNIPKGIGLSVAAKLIQPHPDLRIITIGKSHMHLSKLLESVGGYKFAAATKFVGTPFLGSGTNALTVRQIKGEVDKWAARIKDQHRIKDPASRATIKLLLVWIRGLNPSERSGVATLKKQSKWSADESLFQIAPFNHLTVHEAKKNPHHVMNVQIFKQLTEICNAISGKFTRVIPIAIGDPLFNNMYDPTSGAYIDKSNLDHLIEYWERAPQVLKGAASMLKQRTFLLSLWKKFEIVQIGVRSGMLEFLAYNGLPTVYLERTVDCADPDSGAPRIKQLAYEIEEMYSPALELRRLPWFRMKHRVNVGLSQYERALALNPKAAGARGFTGVNESTMLGYFDAEEMKTLRIGLQNIFQSPWARKMRAVPAQKLQYDMKDVESGKFGLLADNYAMARRTIRADEVPRLELSGWTPTQLNEVPDFLIAAGVELGSRLVVNNVEYRVVQRVMSAKDPTADNPTGKQLFAKMHVRGG